MTYQKQHVPSEGPLDAKVILIGENPWVNEVSNGRPFAGQAGNKLKFWWHGTGLDRTKMRLMNLYPYKPPIDDLVCVEVDELGEWVGKLHERIGRLEEPHVLVPMGNYATWALTGKGKVKAALRNKFTQVDDVGATEAEKKAGIVDLRGSFYPYKDVNGRILKVIPMIHPKEALKWDKWDKRCKNDWDKVDREKEFGEIRALDRKHVIDPSEEEVRQFTETVEYWGEDVILSIDIESWGNQLTCVGFSHRKDWSITIPTFGKKADVFLPYVKRLCESASEKVLCNGLYDWYWLDYYNIQLRNFRWDVSLMHHALDAAESHSLNFLASIYCPHYVFWKDEAKEAEEIIKYAKKLDALWVYNGLDCVYTRELYDLLKADLEREGMLNFYLQHYAGMLEPLLRTTRHGFRVDKEAQKTWAKKLKGEMKGIHAELNKEAGEELFATEEKGYLREPTLEEWKRLFNWSQPQKDALDMQWMKDFYSQPPKSKEIDREVRKELGYIMSGKNAGKIRDKKTIVKKDFSNAKLMEFFYETLELPKQYKLRNGKSGRKRTVCLDEGAIRKLTAKWPNKIENWGNLLLAHREKKKEADYLKGAWDKDGRIRCGYGMLTEAGRLKSHKNPMRRGFNLQNIKR
jgi:uracil-DNA glycosylase family 4